MISFIKMYDTPAYFLETAEKEVQDTSCRGSEGAPPALKVPQDWRIQGVDKDFFSSLYIDGEKAVR